MIKTYTCQNGVRIVHEKMEHGHSVAIGVWVGVGSANEVQEQSGIAHFIEHMLFKGTSTRSARMIAEQFDRMGGDVNAFTSKEMTCFYATVLNSQAPKALTILADMLFNSKFDEIEIEKEKSVVQDEIASVEDTPDDDVDERLWSAMFPNDAIGRPVLGTETTIKTFDKAIINKFMDENYYPENIVISVAGNYDDRLVKLIEAHFGTFKSNRKTKTKITTPQFCSGHLTKEKEIEQAHICIGYSGLSIQDERIHTLILLDSIVGGTMSSRLFQQVREDKGLAYTVESYYSAYKTTGAFMIYAGTSPKKMTTLLQTIDEIISSLIDDGVTNNELRNAKEQLKAGFLLGLENTEARMHRNGKNELILGKHQSIEEVVELIDSIQVTDVQQLAIELFSTERAISIISPLEVHEEVKI